MRIFQFCLTAVSFSAISLPAFATQVPVNTLPAAQSSTSCGKRAGDTVIEYTSGSASGCTGSRDSNEWSGLVDTANGGIALASMTLHSDMPFSEGAGAALKYYFNLQLIDPKHELIDLGLIPVLIDARLRAFANAPFDIVRSSITISSYSGPLFPSKGVAVCSNDCGINSGAEEYEGKIAMLMALDSVFSVELQALVVAGPGESFANASADPYIYVDPSYEYASYFNVVLSEGVQNGSPAAVLEPATWAMMLGGFGAVGSAMRNRRKSAVAFS